MLKFQVNFSDQSMSELKKLDIFQQMSLIDELCSITPEQLENPRGKIGRFYREGKTLYRLRIKGYRFYFERKGTQLYNHFILHQHTLIDFIIRFKLPIKLSPKHHLTTS